MSDANWIECPACKETVASWRTHCECGYEFATGKKVGIAAPRKQIFSEEATELPLCHACAHPTQALLGAVPKTIAAALVTTRRDVVRGLGADEILTSAVGEVDSLFHRDSPLAAEAIGGQAQEQCARCGKFFDPFRP